MRRCKNQTFAKFDKLNYEKLYFLKVLIISILVQDETPTALVTLMKLEETIPQATPKATPKAKAKTPRNANHTHLLK